MAAGKKTKKAKKPQWQSNLEAGAIRALFVWPRFLPYRMRCSVVAWVLAWIIAPLAGYRGRIAANLAHVLPDLDPREVRHLKRSVPANVGRMLTELAAGEDFLDRIRPEPFTGPGVAALDDAHKQGRPIIVVSGHFGNFDAVRGALRLRGHKIGAVYRPLNHDVLEAEFQSLLTAIAEPIFPRGRAGLGQMIRHLRKGNTVAILLDQYVNKGAVLTFFGQPAPTSLSAAEMALKYDALLVPVYGIRRDDGGFDLVVEDPIAHGDALVMTQAINDSLEARVRQNMSQWLWIHRRWKPDRQARRAARQRKAAAPKTSP